MIDVDHFKKYNDHYGHPMGDQCLRQVASGLASVINRPSDLLARFGGEEFVGLLPNTDEAGAVEVAKRMQLEVSSLAIEHFGSDICDKITLSIGVATCYPSVQKAAENHLSLADMQLYRAKQEGRNRICSASDEGTEI
jgi:diguanylate cyclase (GGDEF)-like protein